MKTIKNDFFLKKTEAYLVTINKNIDFMLENCNIDVVTYRNWINNHKAISIDFLNMFALWLKSYQCNIHTTKQLMNEEMTFDLADQKSAKSNIAYLCQKNGIAAKDIYESKAGLAKNTVLRILRGDAEPGFDNLVKFYNFLKTKKQLNLQSHLDLIYFSTWGESERSYIELRNKIKIIE